MRLRQVFVLLTCLSAASYFAYHALHGRHGYKARIAMLDRQNLLTFEIDSLKSVETKLARDVALLSPDIPNADIVEETARDVLGFVRPGDRILQLP
jgi:cell division protein FtsB